MRRVKLHSRSNQHKIPPRLNSSLHPTAAVPFYQYPRPLCWSNAPLKYIPNPLSISPVASRPPRFCARGARRTADDSPSRSFRIFRPPLLSFVFVPDARGKLRCVHGGVWNLRGFGSHRDSAFDTRTVRHHRYSVDRAKKCAENASVELWCTGISLSCLVCLGVLCSYV